MLFFVLVFKKVFLVRGQLVLYMTGFSLFAMDYDSLLKRGRSALPESVNERSRFEIPKVMGHIEGNKTVISNFGQIASALGREVNHLLKFVLKELATPGKLSGNSVIFGTKVSASRINEVIKMYVDEYVLCFECGKPDTKLILEGKITYLKCAACGARRPVKA